MSEINEAKAWLEGAKMIFDRDELGKERYTVITAMCVHAIIRANDSLTIKYLKKKAFRHDEAPELFSILIKEGIISPNMAYLKKEILIPAVSIKSGVDYRGLKINQIKAAEWLSLAEKFIKFAEQLA